MIAYATGIWFFLHHSSCFLLGFIAGLLGIQRLRDIDCILGTEALANDTTSIIMFALDINHRMTEAAVCCKRFVDNVVPHRPNLFMTAII